MDATFVAEDKSHSETSLLNAAAEKNIVDIFSTEDVSH
jgi:hypothetical protein